MKLKIQSPIPADVFYDTNTLGIYITDIGLFRKSMRLIDLLI